MRYRFIVICTLVAFTCDAQFQGGQGSGSDMGLILSASNFFSGGQSDGFAAINWQSAKNYFSGNEGDGMAFSKLSSNLSHFAGGIADGATREKYEHYHLWTGAADDDWLNTLNWTSMILPDTNARVAIPIVDTLGGFSYPLLSAGVFRINDAGGTANFVCRALWIQHGAIISLGTGGETFNYGFTRIEGLFNMNNASFINKSGGNLLISSVGEMRAGN